MKCFNYFVFEILETFEIIFFHMTNSHILKLHKINKIYNKKSCCSATGKLIEVNHLLYEISQGN